MVTTIQIVFREYDFISVSNVCIVPYDGGSSLRQSPKLSFVPRATASPTIERRTIMNSKWRSDVHSPLFSIPERHKDGEISRSEFRFFRPVLLELPQIQFMKFRPLSMAGGL